MSTKTCDSDLICFWMWYIHFGMSFERQQAMIQRLNRKPRYLHMKEKHDRKQSMKDVYEESKETKQPSKQDTVQPEGQAVLSEATP